MPRAPVFLGMWGPGDAQAFESGVAATGLAVGTCQGLCGLVSRARLALPGGPQEPLDDVGVECPDLCAGACVRGRGLDAVEHLADRNGPARMGSAGIARFFIVFERFVRLASLSPALATRAAGPPGSNGDGFPGSLAKYVGRSVEYDAHATPGRFESPIDSGPVRSRLVAVVAALARKQSTFRLRIAPSCCANNIKQRLFKGSQMRLRGPLPIKGPDNKV